MRTLIVEDNSTIQLLLRTLLEQYGDCVVVNNGRKGIDAFCSAIKLNHRFDLVCMDVLMPELDGHEAVKQIRAIEKARGIAPSLRSIIIMITSLSDDGHVIESAQEECNSYLVKPIDIHRLLRDLRSFGLLAPKAENHT